MTTTTLPPRTDRLALAAAIGCFVSWGVFPFLFQAAGRAGATSWEVVGWRVVAALPCLLVMVVATGRSNVHLASIADRVVKDLKAQGITGIGVEGLRQGDWVLIDAGNVIVHLFRPEVRTFYNIEKMWQA